MAERLTDDQLLTELEPTVETLLNSHLNTAREWFPHEFIPYSRGEDFEKGYAWQPEDSGISIGDSERSALLVNLLTEDNLPYYFRTIERTFGADGPWGAWTRQWTAEEQRHSMAIYGYLMTTRAIDPVQLERNRMVQVSGGEIPEPASAADGMVYVALQELATRIAHRNTGLRLNDQAGTEVMKRVAADENLHYIFYKDLTKAAIDIDPSQLVSAVKRQVEGFEMPGGGIPEFDVHEERIALSGIYGVNEFLHGVLEPVIGKQWGIFELDGLDEQADKDREKLAKRMKVLGRLASLEEAKREAMQAALAAAD